MLRRAGWVGPLLLSGVVLAACGSSGSGSATTTTAGPSGSTTTTVGVPPSTTSTSTTVPQPNLTLTIEPADQYASIYQLIRNSQHSLDMAMYELADPRVSLLLVSAHHRGVAVRILLDHTGSAAAVNQTAYAELQSNGVPVRWAPASLTLHQKTLTADSSVAAIMTGNLTSTSYPTTRDFVAFDRSPAAVRSVESVFNRDWNGSATGRIPTVAGLVWSPGARPTLIGLIHSAHHTLAVENEEMSAPAVISALKAASRRGVLVTVTMTYSPAWKVAWTSLTRAGVEVSTYPNTPTALSIHANAMVVDGLTAFVGSQNFSNAGLAHNRELGIITSDVDVVGPLSQTLAADFTGGARFKVRIPPVTGTTHTTVAPSTTTVAPSTATMAPSTTTMAPSTTTVPPSTTRAP